MHPAPPQAGAGSASYRYYNLLAFSDIIREGLFLLCGKGLRHFWKKYFVVYFLGIVVLFPGIVVLFPGNLFSIG